MSFGSSFAEMSLPPEVLQIYSHTAKIIAGPLLIGAFFNAFLFGIVLLQVRTYWLSAKEDPLWRKCVVGFILLFDTINCIFVLWNGYDYTIIKFGNIDQIFRVTTVFLLATLTAAVVILVVQLFFAWQIKNLTTRMDLAMIVAVLSLGQFAAELNVLIRGAIYRDIRNWGPLKSAVIVWLVGAAVTDVLIAVILTVTLKNKRTGFSHTDDIISKLTRLAVQTGSITALTAIVDVIVFLAISDNTHFLLNLPLSKLYTNCLMSSMNARLEWRSNWRQESQQDSRRESYKPSAFRPSAFLNRGSGANNQTRTNGIQVQTTRFVVDADDMAFPAATSPNAFPLGHPLGHYSSSKRDSKDSKATTAVTDNKDIESESASTMSQLAGINTLGRTQTPEHVYHPHYSNDRAPL